MSLPASIKNTYTLYNTLHMDTAFHLRLNARVSIFTGQSTVRIANVTEHRGLGLSADPVHPYDFFVGAWMGNNNPHMQFEMLKGGADGTGSASLSIPILAGDADTFKIGCYIKDPDTHMNRHLVSGFHSLTWLADAIEGVTSFDHSKTSLLVQDNYSKNKVLIHFTKDRKSTRLNSSHSGESRMPSSA